MTLQGTPSRHDMLCFAAHAETVEESRRAAEPGAEQGKTDHRRNISSQRQIV